MVANFWLLGEAVGVEVKMTKSTEAHGSRTRDEAWDEEVSLPNSKWFKRAADGLFFGKSLTLTLPTFWRAPEGGAILKQGQSNKRARI